MINCLALIELLLLNIFVYILQLFPLDAIYGNQISIIPLDEIDEINDVAMQINCTCANESNNTVYIEDDAYVPLCIGSKNGSDKCTENIIETILAESEEEIEEDAQIKLIDRFKVEVEEDDAEKEKPKENYDGFNEYDEISIIRELQEELSEVLLEELDDKSGNENTDEIEIENETEIVIEIENETSESPEQVNRVEVEDQFRNDLKEEEVQTKEGYEEMGSELITCEKNNEHLDRDIKNPPVITMTSIFIVVGGLILVSALVALIVTYCICCCKGRNLQNRIMNKKVLFTEEKKQN